MYYKRPTKGVFSGQIVAGSGHSFRSFIRVFIRVFRVIRGQVIFAFSSAGRLPAFRRAKDYQPPTINQFNFQKPLPIELTTDH